MRHGYGNFGWDGSWMVMAALMVLFWGGLAWVVATLLRRNAAPHHVAPVGPVAPPPPPVPPMAVKPPRDPEAILAERLATGDIDPDDYRQRLQALREHREG